MTCSSAMGSPSGLPPRSPPGAFLPARVGPVPFSMPLGLILGRLFTPLGWAPSARSSAIACCSAAFSASRRSARVSSSPRGRPEREIVLGADMPGEIESNSVPHNPSAHPSPDFCPSYFFFHEAAHFDAALRLDRDGMHAECPVPDGRGGPLRGERLQSGDLYRTAPELRSRFRRVQ